MGGGGDKLVVLGLGEIYAMRSHHKAMSYLIFLYEKSQRNSVT